MWQNKVEEMARLQGWKVFHPSVHQVRPGVFKTDGNGFPDLVLSHHYKGLVFAELKLESGKLSTDQVSWANAIQPWCEYYVWRPSQELLIAQRLSRVGA
jgi:hypothetical protein